MKERPGRLTRADVEAAGQVAGKLALDQLDAAGLPVMGLARNAAGEVWLVRRSASGEVEWLELADDDLEALEEPDSVEKRRAG